MTLGKIDNSKNIASIERSDDKDDVKTIIEWNKADVSEPIKIELESFGRLSSLQTKVIHCFKPYLY